MRLVTGKDQLLRALAARGSRRVLAPTFQTGLAPLDGLAPGGAFQSGAVHELLAGPQGPTPTSFALLLAKAARGDGAVAWSDPARELYPPALAAAGLDLGRLILLRPKDAADQTWALAECLRCRGVGATVAAVGRLSHVEARRLQLAAERGGGVGLLLRPAACLAAPYAAVTRWRVEPAPGDEHVQRWAVQLLHGHGGRIGERVFLEVDHETHVVRASAAVADRPALPASSRATA